MELPDFLVIPSILIKDREINSLDREVYGIIYWYSRMKNEKCTASNNHIAQLLGSSAMTISHSLSRLAKKGYITVLLDNNNHRVEIIPNIHFTPRPVNITPIPTGIPPLDPQVYPHPIPTGIQNNIRVENKKRKNKNIDTNVSIQKSRFLRGNGDINEISSYFLYKMGIPKEGCTQLDSRRYWNLLLKESKKGKEGVKWLIDLAAQDAFFKNNITSSKELFYQRIKLIARKRGEKGGVLDATHIA